jgi:hypothetical protein
MLEIYMRAVDNTTGESFLDAVNLGVGYYSDEEYWQQVEAYRNGLYADSAMTEKVIRRAVLQTKRRMVDAIVDGRHDARLLKRVDYPDPGDGQSRQGYFEEHIDDVWEDLGYETADGESYGTHEHQAWLVHVCTDLDMDWTPPHWRMLKARHEASKSKGARLIDNLFGRPPEPDPVPMGDYE